MIAFTGMYIIETQEMWVSLGWVTLSPILGFYIFVKDLTHI
jgi:hypothetical protein